MPICLLEADGPCLFVARESRWGAWLLVTWAEPDQGVISVGAQWGLQEEWEWKEVGAQELPSHDKFTSPPFCKGLDGDPLMLSLWGFHSDAEFAFVPGPKALEQVC